MKKNMLYVKQLAGIVGGVFLMSLPMGFVSCKEEIDESNFAIKKEQTAADFIESDAQFSMIKQVFQTVRLGSSTNASPIFSALTARGNYTVFLPSNEAMAKYLGEQGFASIDELLKNEEKATLVAKSCIIDNGDEAAFETADFPVTGAFSKPNLNDRLLSCKLDDESNFIINGIAMVVDEDNEVSNGFVHVVNSVVAPSALTLDKLIASADNMKAFSYLLEKTGWNEKLRENLDVKYENPDRPLTYKLENVDLFNFMQHRYIGYTAFIEPDSVYKAEFGIEFDEQGKLVDSLAFLQKVAAYAEPIYGNGSAGAEDYTNEDNAVNRFVAYHLLDGKMAYNNILHHYNEIGYKFGDPKNPQTKTYPTNVWDFFTTKGKHRELLMVTQVGESSMVEADKMNHPIYVNRISNYANGPEEDYKEESVVPGYEGLLVSATNGENDNNGLNGYYYPVNKLLACTQGLRREMQKRRIRIDVTTMLPELLSNNVRGGVYMRFENGYFDNISRESPDTKLLYLQNYAAADWNDYQGDEFMVSGLYDFTMQLPPVPETGNYEIRMGVAHNSLRGMCQIYFGDDPDRLKPAGLPYDMRQPGGPDNPAMPWTADVDDWIINIENDRNLRNQGYMKAPMYFTICNGNGTTADAVRKRGGVFAPVRRIVTVAHMERGKKYYLRFKTALKKTDSQFFMDYFEFASTSVYNGPVAEDIW